MRGVGRISSAEWDTGHSEDADEINQPCIFHLLNHSAVREMTAKRGVGQLALQNPVWMHPKFCYWFGANTTPAPHPFPILVEPAVVFTQGLATTLLSCMNSRPTCGSELQWAEVNFPFQSPSWTLLLTPRPSPGNSPLLTHHHRGAQALSSLSAAIPRSWQHSQRINN